MGRGARSDHLRPDRLGGDEGSIGWRAVRRRSERGLDGHGLGASHRQRGPHAWRLGKRWTAAAALLAALAIVASACAAAGPADTSEAPSITVDISDFKITTDRPTIASGHVVVGIINHASMLHELKVIKTDLAPDQLPVDGATAKAKEEGKVGELLNIAAGASRKLVLELTPGKYVLICNIAGHYQLGMRVGLEVR
jgi:uncharacterized cupredoxin-like copper-binding protein